MNDPRASRDERPLLLLDVDGVIAPLEPPAHGREGTDWVRVESLGVWILTGALARISHWHHQQLVEVRWLTTWEAEAPKELGPLFDLPDWPHLERGRHRFSEWWKFRHVWDRLQQGRRVVWLDDEISYWLVADHVPFEMAARLLEIQPDSNVGLTRDDLDAVETWVHATTGAVQ